MPHGCIAPEPVSKCAHPRFSYLTPKQQRPWLAVGRRDLLRHHADKSVSATLAFVWGDGGVRGLRGTSLAEALRRIESHEASVLVLYRLDRPARDLLLQETVVERLRMGGASVISLSEPDLGSHEPTRILVRQVLGALAQYEMTFLRPG